MRSTIHSLRWAGVFCALAAVGCDGGPTTTDDSGAPLGDGGIDQPDAQPAPDAGSDAGPQPTTFMVHVENVAPFTNAKTGTYTMRTDGSGPGAIAPGGAFEVTFTAGPRHRLVLASMFGQSNDWFFAPAPGGIPLYDGEAPISGDVTDQILLWDAGTEVDEEPAVGQHTGPRQSTSTDGPGAADPDDTVRLVPDPVTLTDGSSFDRPDVADMIRVTITSDAETRTFTLRVENVADDASTLMTSEGPKPVRISPGVWALSTGADDEPIFSEGAADRGEGLEGLSEMGAVTDLAAALEGHSGVATPISPGVFVIHTTPGALFTAGEPDRGLGLENIAERGDISVLAASLESALPDGASAYGTYDTPVGATEAGPIRAGGAFDFEVTALPGDHLSFAMMYGASNDWVFATVEDGIALFDGDAPRTGDVTSDLRIWDVGTELSEEPGIGAHVGAPEGAADDDPNVREVTIDAYATPVDQHVRVTLTVASP